LNHNYETSIFSVQKSGNKEEENEDAYAIGKNGNLIAISDGASDSFSSRIWAQLLSKEFIDKPIDFNNKEVFLAWLESIQQKWLEKIDWEKLPWFMKEKAKGGDFASLLTLTISEERNRFISYAIGDSCLFIIRENKCLTFPIEKSNEFNNYPYLISSHSKNNVHVFGKIKMLDCEIRENDIIIMATDSMAKWILQEYEAGSDVSTQLTKMDSELFKDFVKGLRRSKELRNDDSTIILIKRS